MQNVEAATAILQLEVGVLLSAPLVQELGNLNGSTIQLKATRHLLSTMVGTGSDNHLHLGCLTFRFFAFETNRTVLS